MDFQSKLNSIPCQIIELELLLDIEILVISHMEINREDSMYLDIKKLFDKPFQKFLQKKVGVLNFCPCKKTNSLFHYYKEKEYFLLYDFNDIFEKYNRNKFEYFYDNF